ncbi:MAG: phage scaffolding protein [Bradymonadia bacterium]|jgi:hypothetical protein
MTKEQLLKLGLSEEHAKAVLQLLSNGADPKNDAQALEITKLKEAVAQRDAQIASLKSFEGDAKTLKEQVENLQKKNAEEAKRYKDELLVEQKRFAVKQALLSGDRKPHDVDLAVAQFDLASISIDENGKAIGVKEQQEQLLAKKAFLFAEAKSDASAAPIIQGLNVHPKSNEAVKTGAATQDFSSIGKSVAARSLSLLGVAPKA